MTPSQLPCIGLFGTCDDSLWREPFIQEYQARGIPFFNPQVPHWKPEFAAVEAEHLATDAVILFPITGETYGFGSLSEVGFCTLNVIRQDVRRDFVVLIEPKLAPRLFNNPTAAKESLRSRALAIQHLRKLQFSNLYVTDSMAEMLHTSIQLYAAAKIKAPLRDLIPHLAAR